MFFVVAGVACKPFSVTGEVFFAVVSARIVGQLFKLGEKVPVPSIARAGGAG